VGGSFKSSLQTKATRPLLRIPPTAVGGSFKSSLQKRRRLDRFFESHPRQWVDRSSPAYKRRRPDRFFESHPRQWVDRSSPACKGEPTAALYYCLLLSPAARRQRGDEKRGPRCAACRQEFERSTTTVGGFPPTTVGGIQRSGRAAFVCRLDLNDPPTAVGGIYWSWHAVSKMEDCSEKLKSWAATTGSVSADGGSRIVAASAQMTGST
jgi:hypothetical protein